VKYGGRAVMKLSPEKATLPSEKQVFRFSTSKGKLRRDILGLRDDKMRDGKPLLKKVMTKGKIKVKLPTLPQIQKTFLEEFANLDKKYKTLGKRGAEYPVSLSTRLRSLRSRMIPRLEKDEIGES